MKQALCRRVAIVVLAFVPAALADLNETTILQADTTLNLDTGAIASSGGDILWNGSAIAPQGSAKASSLGNVGASGFGFLPLTYLAPLAAAAKSAPIAANLLVPGDVFVVLTNRGHTAKVLVIANSGGLISLRFTTFGVSAAPGVPAIAETLNSFSRIQPGLPNYGIAPSSLFVVVGSGLADPGDPAPQPGGLPSLPLTLNGASITVVVNGVTVYPALYSASPRQLAAVLPAATPAGTGALTVTYQGATSAPAPIQIVPSAPGIDAYNRSGVAADAATGDPITYTNSGSPGQTIVLRATGLGADPDETDTNPHSVDTPLQIYIGGVLAVILFQGTSPDPGVNQISLTIPDSVPPGCWVPVAAVTGDVISNVVTLPINPGGGACIDVQSGLTGDQVLGSGPVLRTGLVSLIHTNSPGRSGSRNITSSANAAFIKYTGLYAPTNSVSPGGCILNDLTPVPFPGLTGLDVGVITLAGPAGLSVTLRSQAGIKGAFFATLAAGAIPSSGGRFTFKGSGGADVGPFTATVEFSNPLLTWTNPSAAATVDKTQGLLVTWTGGNPGAYVAITGTSTSTGLGLVAGYTCLAPVEAGQFTVPSYILLGLPAGNGGTLLQNNIYSSLARPVWISAWRSETPLSPWPLLTDDLQFKEGLGENERVALAFRTAIPSRENGPPCRPRGMPQATTVACWQRWLQERSALGRGIRKAPRRRP
ncbi:MAG: hypothetical protein HYR60_07975 [Acidobacteria bacterium]|nr:hypothetical protein [Acidobacteriota bacterium]